MLKKIAKVLVVAALMTAALTVDSKPVDAQVIYTRQCCDSAGYVRCVLVNWTPVGNSCYCPAQGWGWAC